MADPSKESLPPLRQDPHARRLLLIIGYMVVVAGAAYAVTVVWPVIRALFNILMPFIVAFVVAYLFNPIVNFVQRRLHLSRVAGVVFVNLIIVLILSVFIGIILPILYRQVGAAYGELKEFASREVFPRVAAQFDVSLQPSEPTHGEYLEFLQEWKNAQSRLAKTDDQHMHLDRLQSAVDNWMSQALAADQGAESIPHLEQLRGLIDEWIKAYPKSGGPDSIDLPLETLHDQTSEWIDARISWIRGEPRDLELKDFWKQFDLWLSEKGIFLEEIASKAISGGQVQDAASQGATIVGAVFVAIGAALKALFTSAIFLVFVFLVSFYLLIDFAKLRGVAEIIIPDPFEDRFFDVLHKVDAAVGGFIRGQIIVATTVGILATIGLWFLGLKQYAVLIGIITGIGNLIPYLGPIMGATPAVIYILVSDTYTGMQERLIRLLMLLGLFALIQFIEGFILQPKVVGKSAQLHPVIVILALALGAPFGIMGMIIALPIAAATRVLLKEFYWDKREARWRETTGKEKLDDIIIGGRRVQKKKIRQKGKSVKKLIEESGDEKDSGNDES